MKNKLYAGVVAGLILFVALFFSLAANASAATCSANSVAMVQKSYIAYYGRPADPGGLDYWACRLDSVGGDMNSIIEAFGSSSEFNTRFGALNNDQLLDNVYQQILSRSPDPSGKDFYLAKLNSGEMTLQTITIDILNGITGSIDADTFNNKYTVANYFSDQLRSSNGSYGSIEDACLILSSVDGAISSINSAMSACDSLITVLLPAVEPPATITVSANDEDGNYTVSWGASPTPEASYTLQEATDSTFTSEVRTVYTGTWLTTSLTGRTTGTTYYYRVKTTKSGYPDSGWMSGTNGCLVGGNINSFSPVLCNSSSTTDLFWRYQINSGNPVSTTVEGSPLTINFNDLQLTITPNTCLRKGTFDGTIASESVSGNFTASTSENLNIVAGKTLVNETDIVMDMQLFASGQSLNIALDLMERFSPAAEWFLNRSDLDQLAIGYVYDQEAVNFIVSGSISVAGETQNIPPTSASSPEKWTVIGKQESMVINGKIYNNIVTVSRTTLSPGFDFSAGSAPSQNMTIIYWVAKGIGMIRGEAYLNFLGNSLTVDLVDTNLPL